MSKVSICCLAHNHAKFCEEAINSIYNQNYDNIEIIVLDDGSQDDTYQILLNVAKKSPFPIKIITQKNSANIGQNLNICLQNSTGDLVMFLSLDDKFCQNIIKDLVDKILEKNETQIVTSATHIEIDNSSVVIDEYDFSKKNYQIDIKKASLSEILELEKEGGAFWLMSSIWKKSLIDSVNGFDEDIIGDDIVLRVKTLQHMIKNGYGTIDFIDKSVFQYRKHDNQIHRNRERQCQILYEVLQRYFNRQNSKTLQKWIINTILSYIIKLKFKDAIRLIFFDKKNMSKIKTFFIIPIICAKFIFKKIFL